MVWIEDKSVGLVCPYFADVFEGCEALATASRDDIRYIYSTFPIVAQHERDKWGGCKSEELCLAWINALMAGQPDADVKG